LWNAREDDEVYTVPLAGGLAIGLTFDPTGRRLAALDHGHQLFVLDAPPEKIGGAGGGDALCRTEARNSS
jgi:hypothetical protein